MTFRCGLCAVDAADGKIIWDVEVLRPEPDAARPVHTKNSLASSTPIVDGDRLYVHFGHMGTAALDLEGNVSGDNRRDLSARCTATAARRCWSTTCSSSVATRRRDPFVVGARSQRPATSAGERRETRRPAKKFSFSTPLVIEVDGEEQIISAGSGFVGATIRRRPRNLARRYGEGYSVCRDRFSRTDCFSLPPVSTGRRSWRSTPKAPAGDATERHVLWTHEAARRSRPR